MHAGSALSAAGKSSHDECGQAVKIVSDAGIIMLLCTLPGGHEGKHYDAVFCQEWR